MFRTRNCRLPLITATLGILLSMLMCGAHAGDIEKAEYDKGFGARDAVVRASRSSRKVAEFAGELLECAKLVREDQPYQAYLFNKSYEIGMLFPGGIPFAVEAMDQLGNAQPQLKGAADVNLLNAMQKRYQTSAGSPRTAAASAYIDRALQIADSLAADGKYDEAVVICDKAKTALAASAARHNDVLERALMFKDQQATARRIATLKVTLKTTPHDAVAAGELVHLLMLDNDTPDQAFPYVDATGDAKLKKIVALAAKDVAALTEGESLELGDWYRGQMTKAGMLASYTAGSHAKVCYQHFLDAHPKLDADRLNATRALKEADVALAKASSVGRSQPKVSATVPPVTSPPLPAGPIAVVPRPVIVQPPVSVQTDLSPEAVAYLRGVGVTVGRGGDGIWARFDKPIGLGEWPAVLRALSAVQEVSCGRECGTDTLVTQIAKLPLLTHLFIPGQPVTDVGVSSLAHHPTLTYVNLNDTHVTGASVVHLATITNLRELWLARTAVRGPVLKPLLQSRKLAILNLCCNSLVDLDVMDLAGHPSLEDLDLSKTNISGGCAEALVQIPTLRHVHVFLTHFNDDAVICLSRHPGIESLELGACPIGSRAAAALPNFKSLQSLSFWPHGQGFSDADVASIGKCSRLINLDFGGSLLTNHQVELLGGLKYLISVSLTSDDVDEACLAFLPSSTIERLSLGRTHITDKGIVTALKRFPNLKQIYIGNTAISDATISALKHDYPNLTVQK